MAAMLDPLEPSRQNPAISPPVRRERVLSAVRRAVRRHDLWRPGAQVLLACSGGADSMAALDLLDRLQPSLGHRLLVCHVDHGLWPGSAVAAQRVRETCQGRGLPYWQRDLALAKGADLEGRARLLRYLALGDVARQQHCTVVATAHHADDQAETVLLRLARGAGPDALAGIRRHRDDGPGLAGVVRPFLELPRAWLRAFSRDLPLTEDPSNGDLAFSRNALRHEVLPVLERVLPGAAAGLARTASHLAAQSGALDAWVTAALTLCARHDEPGGILTLATPGLPADAAQWLRFAARQLGVPVPSLRATEQFRAALHSGARTCAIMGLRIEMAPGHVRFCRTGVARGRGAD